MSFKTLIIVVAILAIVAFLIRNPLLIILIVGLIIACVFYSKNKNKPLKEKMKKEQEEKAMEESEFWHGKTEIDMENDKIIFHEPDPKFRVTFIGPHSQSGIIVEMLDEKAFEECFKPRGNKNRLNGQVIAAKELHKVATDTVVLKNMESVVAECQKNKRFAQAFGEYFYSGGYYPVDEYGDYTLLFSSDGKKAFFVRGGRDWNDRNCVGFVDKPEKMEFLKELSPNLEDYTDLVGNKVSFTVRFPDVNYWNEAKGYDWEKAKSHGQKK